MKKYFLLFILVSSTIAFADSRKVFGTVTDGVDPLEEVVIKVLDTDQEVLTTTTGKYEVMAAEGQIIEYAHPAMKTIRIRVEDVTRVLNIKMYYDAEQLDEVVLEERLKEKNYTKYLETQYFKNPNIIYTINGYIDATVSAGFVKVYSGDRVGPRGLCFLALLESRFPNLSVSGDCVSGNATVTSGRAASLSDARRADGLGENDLSFNVNGNGVIFDVDGQVFQYPPVWLLTSDVEKIALINGRSGAAFYSSFGASAVVIVNTVQSIPLSLKNGNMEYKDTKMVFAVLDKKEVSKSWPTYLKQLHGANSLKEAKAVYQKFYKTHASSPDFLLDSYRFFYHSWFKDDFADEIIEKNYYRIQTNPVQLKALAYVYDSQKRFDKSNELYREVFQLRPNYVQSYHDLAHSYVNIKQPKKALSIYERFNYLIEEGFIRTDNLGFTPIIKKDYENLLLSIDDDAIALDEEQANLIGKTRMTFEWSDSETEFEMSFINADKHFSKMNYSLQENTDKVSRAKDHGYSIFERFVDANDADNWTIYTKYLGNKRMTPSYLKITVYHNYGTKNQRKDISTFKLFLQDRTKELLNIKESETLVLQ
ncbi:MAG: tetratricopeptide repeat protein [Bacteroidota bacterium]